MSVLFYGQILFLLSFMLHIVIWRIKLPKRQTKTILLIFFSILAVGIALFVNFRTEFAIFKIKTPTNTKEYFQLLLLFSSQTFAYVITYSAIEADSPSLLIIYLINQAKQEGLNRESFERILNDKILIRPRIEEMLRDKLICVENEKYFLSKKGLLMANVILFSRTIMRMGKGG